MVYAEDDESLIDAEVNFWTIFVFYELSSDDSYCVMHLHLILVLAG